MTASRMDFCRMVEVLISRMGRKISFNRTSISFCNRNTQNGHPNHGVAHLKLVPHARQDPPEDLARQLEDVDDGAERIPAQAETEVLLDSHNKGRPLACRVGQDANGGVCKERQVVVQDRQDKVEGEQLGAHGVAAEVSL
jgi:hypothetical protein